MSAIVIGALVSVLGLFGLVLAAGALDSGMYQFGIALFAFAALYVGWLVKKHYDGIDIHSSS